MTELERTCATCGFPIPKVQGKRFCTFCILERYNLTIKVCRVCGETYRTSSKKMTLENICPSCKKHQAFIESNRKAFTVKAARRGFVAKSILKKLYEKEIDVSCMKQ